MKTITITKRDGRAECSEDLGLTIDLLRNGTYDVEITQRREGSTKAQARLLWMWLSCVQRETGDQPTTLYKHYCREFLTSQETVYGQQVSVTGTTGELSRKGMAIFLDKVREDVLQRTGIRLPLPGDRMFEQFKTIYG